MIEHPSPNFSKRPPGFDIDILLLHYTGMESCQAAIDRLAPIAAGGMSERKSVISLDPRSLARIRSKPPAPRDLQLR